MAPKIAVVIAGGTLIGAACTQGTASDILVSRRAEPPATWMDDTETDDTEQDDTEQDDTETLPDSDATAPDSHHVRLSIGDALLRDGDVPPPWEEPLRFPESPGDPIGPNRTDCEMYWDYERLWELPGGGVFWWSDGGSFNHDVFRAASANTAATFVEAFRDLPEVCPVITWDDGDAFRVEPLDLGDEAIVGFDFVHPSSDLLDRLAITAHGDLISALWIVQWPSTDGVEPTATVADIARFAQLVRDRLLAASPLPAPTTTTTVPRTPVPGGGVGTSTIDDEEWRRTVEITIAELSAE